ncbi:DUF4917 family protein [Arsenophonus apicola]|uniref:DUF4917 family protein n=1 Tax=Arsenophonus apicola TaxID=2879119 RepID=UPI00387908B8
MSHQISDWNAIAQDFVDGNGALLIGNGASRAVDTRFEYISLFKHAKKKLMTADVQKLFTFFKTKDFELVLRLVWQATNINQALGISDNKTRDAYLHIRDCLIEVVREIHPDYQEIAEQTISTIYSFIKQFHTVLSLNYDLILYWAVMYGRDKKDGYEVKDCFINKRFDDDWRRFREPLRRNSTNTTLVFYPHGNLMLCRNKIESEYKITVSGEDNNLLKSILKQWKTENYVPLFVSEGTATQKINAIKSSNYLNIVYREVLTDLGKKLVIYGWAISEQDQHILDRIKLSKPEKVAVSVYDNDQVYCNKVEQIISDKFGANTDIVFYKSDSSGCWKN